MNNTTVFLGYPDGTNAATSIENGTELNPDFPREWFEVYNPDDPFHLFTFDVTWLASYYQCGYGTTCQGIDGTPSHGCCPHGAFLVDAAERRNLTALVPQLTRSEWEKYTDEPEGWMEWDEIDDEPNPKTAVVNGMCIFANSASFPGGTGCALHLHALNNGLDPVQVKPEVCWQLPLRRLEDYEDRADGSEILHTTITEYIRRGWGDGGEDFTWYCTTNPACHNAAEPLWKTAKSELIAMCGEKVYALLADFMKSRGTPTAVHPASANRVPGRESGER